MSIITIDAHLSVSNPSITASHEICLIVGADGKKTVPSLLRSFPSLLQVEIQGGEIE